jgi:hypothetical protein
MAETLDLPIELVPGRSRFVAERQSLVLPASLRTSFAVAVVEFSISPRNRISPIRPEFRNRNRITQLCQEETSYPTPTAYTGYWCTLT